MIPRSKHNKVPSGTRDWASYVCLAALSSWACQVGNPSATTHPVPPLPPAAQPTEPFQLSWFDEECVSKDAPVWPIESARNSVLVPPVRTGPETLLHRGSLIERGYKLSYEGRSLFIIRQQHGWFLSESPVPTQSIFDVSSVDAARCNRSPEAMTHLLSTLPTLLGMETATGCTERDSDGNWVERPCQHVRDVVSGERLLTRLPSSHEWRLSVGAASETVFKHVVRTRGRPALGCEAVKIVRRPTAVLSLIAISPTDAETTIEMRASRCLARTVLTSPVPIDDTWLRERTDVLRSGAP